MISPFSSVFLLLFFPLILFFSSLELSYSESQSQTPSLACQSTPYPKLCRSILRTFNSSPSNPYNYGEFSVKESLKRAQHLSKTIKDTLVHQKQRSKLTHLELGSFQDCSQLTDLNVDYLQSIGTLLMAAQSLSDELVDKVTSLLSAIVTNQQTCYDGLAESKSSFATVLYEPLSNVTRLYSISLGLVTHSLDRNLKRNKRSKGSQNPFLKNPNPVREPLETLIKVLRKPKGSCIKCYKGERTLDELQRSGGILLNQTVIVSQDGTENFTTITDAIEFAPNDLKPEDGYFVIYARQGYYEDYVIVSKYKKNILLIGDGVNQTVITGHHSVIDGWTTFNSSTFAVSGERFVAVDVTFRNTAGPAKHQAVALRNNADLSTFYRCSFEGYQDTLYVHSLRQFYRECDIYGTVDFIFGNAAAVFQNCNLYARKPMTDQKNVFTAQGRTDPNQNTGISIHNCTIKAAPDLAMDLNSTLNYLGRPWKLYSRTVYMQSYIGDLINPKGWLEWNGTVGLDTLYYGEFENFGPGANTSGRVNWPGYNKMNATEAVNFTVYNFTMGDTWLPYTDVPFNEGLLVVN